VAEDALENGEEPEMEPEGQDFVQPEFEATKSEPEVYTCDYINERRKEMTELQWEEYTKSLIGKPIEYEGDVIEVYDDGRIQIAACNGIIPGIPPFIIYGTNMNIAIKLSKGQFIKGEGKIKEVGTFISMYIDVNGETIE